MNILLIYPKFPETFWSFTYALSFIGKKAAFPPLPSMVLDSLLNGYQSIMKHIYSPKNYYRRVRTLLRDLKAPEINQPINVGRFLSIFRSAFRLGVLGKERFRYWQLMLWTLIRVPRQLPVAITLAIYGYHYRRICELHIY